MIDESMFQERVERLKKLQEPECLVEEEAEAPEPFSFLRLLTYPFNAPGLSVMAVYVLLPFLLWVIIMILPGVFRLAGGLLLLLLTILITLSTLWYLTVCIRASAEGQVKAPDVFEFSQDDSFWDWLRTFFLLLAIVAVCISPAVITRFYLTTDPVAVFGILAAGVFFLPMMLLAVVMFDTINALNPVLIIGSVFSTFFHYCGIVLLFMIPLGMVVGINIVGTRLADPLLELLAKAVGLYLFMLDACLLGRFFYHNEEKLRWDV